VGNQSDGFQCTTYTYETDLLTGITWQVQLIPRQSLYTYFNYSFNLLEFYQHNSIHQTCIPFCKILSYIYNTWMQSVQHGVIILEIFSNSSTFRFCLHGCTFSEKNLLSMALQFYYIIPLRSLRLQIDSS